jgi:hypothetical protein
MATTEPRCPACGARIRKRPLTPRPDRDAQATIFICKQPAPLPPLPKGTSDTGGNEW